MAVITTSVDLTNYRRVFDSPASVSGSRNGLPLAAIEVNHNFTTTGSGVGDTEQLTAELELPRNYGYRLLSWNVTLYGAAFADVSEWAKRTPLLSLYRGPGFDTYYTQLGPTRYNNGGTYYANQPAVYDQTNLYATATFSLGLDQVAKQPFQTSALPGANPYIRMSWTQGTASINGCSMNCHATLLQYTVEDMNSYQVWAVGNLLS
jgi:hypothetical protein